MSWSWERPVYGTVSQAASIRSAATVKKTPREGERPCMAGILPDGHVPQRNQSGHDRFGPSPPHLELHPHRHDLPAVSGGEAIVIEIREGEASHTLGDGLGASARIASQRRF